MKRKIGFIGLGLIGGSIAKAIRQYYPDSEIVAFDKNKEALALATQESVIDVAVASIDDNFRNCDYLFLCTPVACNCAYLKQLGAYMHDNCILTDVGSVKTDIHREAKRLGLEPYFIGGHPMAGSEKSGYMNAKAMLIENAYYVLTPSEEISQEKVDRYIRFAENLRAIPVIMEPEQHDYVTGAISHLPHLIAASLVNFVKDHDTRNEMMKNLAAGGFKDITRIASSSPSMWQHICMKNRENISQILGSYIDSLSQVKNLIDTEDEQGVYDLFDTSRNYRNSFPGVSAGPIKKAFAVYCDIIDEAGGIAAIATILASNGLNIKNIGIVHNREFEEGVLRIEFYDEASSQKASELLQKFRYIVYER
ncbi:prephenate dehydrogenase [Lachnospiraceae bacterium KGMB03038]|nr:prephenate dehydrogenase [Lachnospiraceae bacterium KGMB03038]